MNEELRDSAIELVDAFGGVLESNTILAREELVNSLLGFLFKVREWLNESEL